MGTRYTSLDICKKCGFEVKVQRESWGDCDFENSHIESESCQFCRHAKKLKIDLDKVLKR